MHRHFYQQPRTYQRYDEEHIIGYLNEEVLNNYQPQSDGGDNPEPWPTAYAYTGTESDGGTIMECKKQDDYGEIANAIIRSRYSESQELSIQRHAINGDYAEAGKEYEDYYSWCQNAVELAKKWVLGTLIR